LLRVDFTPPKMTNNDEYIVLPPDAVTNILSFIRISLNRWMFASWQEQEDYNEPFELSGDQHQTNIIHECIIGIMYGRFLDDSHRNIYLLFKHVDMSHSCFYSEIVTFPELHFIGLQSLHLDSNMPISVQCFTHLLKHNPMLQHFYVDYIKFKVKSMDDCDQLPVLQFPQTLESLVLRLYNKTTENDTFSTQIIEHICKSLHRCQNLERLSLTFIPNPTHEPRILIRSNGIASYLRNITQLKQLCLVPISLQDDDESQILFSHPSVTNLDILCFDDFADSHIDTILHTGVIKELVLFFNNPASVSNNGIKRLLQSNGVLTSLDIASDTSKIDTSTLLRTQLSNENALERLHVYHSCDADNANDHVIAETSINIQSLKFSCTCTSNAFLDQINANKLKELSLHDCTNFSRFKHLTSLSLYTREPDVSNKLCEYFAEECVALSNLELCLPKSTSVQVYSIVEAIVESTSNDTLKRLSMNSMQLEDDGIICLLENNASITKLDISETNITDKG
jgi:hypothetical protein